MKDEKRKEEERENNKCLHVKKKRIIVKIKNRIGPSIYGEKCYYGNTTFYFPRMYVNLT